MDYGLGRTFVAPGRRNRDDGPGPNDSSSHRPTEVEEMRDPGIAVLMRGE
jgi:hypothetical protein